MDTTEINQRINNAKVLDFGTIFNQSIELFKKVWVQGLITLLLNVVLAIPVVLTVYIPLILFGVADAFSRSSDYNSYDSYGSTGISIFISLVMFVLYIVLIVALSTIGLALKAAFYRICKLRDLEELGKEDYFYFLRKPYLGKTIKLSLAFSGIAIASAMLCFLPLIYVIVPLSFMVVVYAFNPDLAIKDIIKLAFFLGNKKWLFSAGLMIVSGFLAMIIGFLMCGFGVYVTSSFGQLPAYFIYKDVVGFNYENDQLSRIEQLGIE
ncbi:hypothetical protein [Winogradskyella wichelsiae]|uniref:hypothetical protein n=1 Tax=Winogradskyella wichelsiae TaxID=2697007 RepID=UPI0015CE0191|nr:hypothetical protein [Winogradskyella wichelsiae]